MKELELLKGLGLTEYESKIFLALVRLGPSKVKDIYKDCYVPKNKIYESLQSLLLKGIIESLPTTPKRYLAKSTDSLNSLLKKKIAEMDCLKQGILELKRIKRDSTPLPSKEPVWITYGHESFSSKVKDAVSSISNENLILAVKLRSNPTLLRLTRQAILRGAKVRILVLRSENRDAKAWARIGAEVRFLGESPSMPFSTFDDSLCRLNLSLDDVSDPTLWIENPAFVQILKDKFNRLWKAARLSHYSLSALSDV